MTNSCLKRRPVRRVDLSVNMEKTGQNIKNLIKNNGYTVKDIMEITGLSTEQAIYKWFRGESIPSTESQLILCSVMGLKINELLVIDGEFERYSDTLRRRVFRKLRFEPAV